MTPKRSLSPFRMAAVFGGLAGLFLAAACAPMQTGQLSAGGPAMAEEKLPRYATGESFLFDDGRIDTVISVDGETVTWRDDRGILRWIHRNFLLPDIAWQNSSRRSRSQTTAEPGLLWPLQVGNSGRFDFQQTVQANDGSEQNEYRQSWQCEVSGTEVLFVPAGTFDVYKIPCYRYIHGTSTWRQTRTYYYAPRVGHYVKRTDVYASRPSRERSLIGAGFNSTALPGREQAALNTLAQAVLNNNPDGVPSTWSRPDGTLKATLTPLRTFQGANGEQCREYQSAYDVEGRRRVNHRNVCKLATGLWQRVR